MVGPEPKFAPVIPPETVPIVQLKVLGTDDVKPILGLVPLQMLSAGELVTVGAGLTVTVIIYGTPAHDPAVDVGVTIYCTVPAAPLPGLESI